MKIAILFTGRINDNLNIYNNFSFCLGYMPDTDIFISYPQNTDKELVERVKNLYNPLIMIENNESFFDASFYLKPPETNVHNCLSMYKSRANICAAFQQYMLQTNKSYDYVICTRMDNFYKYQLDYQNICLKKSLFIPTGQDWRDGINDQFACGYINEVVQYMNCYYYLQKLLNEGIILHPESLLKAYLKCIEIKILRFDYEYEIKRV